MSGLLLFGVSESSHPSQQDPDNITNKPSNNNTADKDDMSDDEKPVLEKLSSQSAVLLGRQLSEETAVLLSQKITASAAARIETAAENSVMMNDQLPILSLDKVRSFVKKNLVEPY